MKKYIAGIATGVILSCTVALAVNYTATENTFPIQLNGENVNVEGTAVHILSSVIYPIRLADLMLILTIVQFSFPKTDMYMKQNRVQRLLF